MPGRARRLLREWFGTEGGSAAALERWFRPDPGEDERLRREFEDDVVRADRGELASWGRSPRGRLALILLLDQLPRSLYRGTRRAFASDAAGLELAADGIGAGLDQSLAPLERAFFYMPLMHSERLADQDESVRRYTELRRDAPTEHATALAEFELHARRHRRLIARFGRFPARNRALGRASSDAERAYLRRSESDLQTRRAQSAPNPIMR